ncbi:hypothetical protein CLOM_g12986 [Closterium sp. NIES-68]|nr:hypothetical protein CLOM_g12986 [Closterium sp. NIES-68]GJP74588.1 hypothetical protein CLOP_g5148 [Closterium sp. NIES-67]
MATTTTLLAGRAAMPAVHLHASCASPPPHARFAHSARSPMSEGRLRLGKLPPCEGRPQARSLQHQQQAHSEVTPLLSLIRPRSARSLQQLGAFRCSSGSRGLNSHRNNARRCVQASSAGDGSTPEAPTASNSSDSSGSQATVANTTGDEARSHSRIPESNATIPSRAGGNKAPLSAVAASAVACLASLLVATAATTAASPFAGVAPALAEPRAVTASGFGGAFNAGLDTLLPFLTSAGSNAAINGNDAGNGADAQQLGALAGVGELALLGEGQFAPLGGAAAVAEEYIRPGHRPDLPMTSPLFGPARQADEPQQVHISLAGPGAMRVTWLTADGEAPAVVQYGDAPGRYTHTVTGTTTSYSFLFYRSGFIHSAVIGGPEQPLAPNTVYYYRVGTTADATADATLPAAAAEVAAVGASATGATITASSSDSVEQLSLISSGRGIVGRGFTERSFKTLPADPSDSINIAIVGDMGQTGWTVSTLDHIAQQPHDLLVLPGDLSYADAYQPRWDTWHNLIEPLASSRPWMVVPGNHEIESLPGLVRPFTAYNARWPMPAAQSASPSNLFYSFESAGVHWVMLNSYSDFEPDSVQGQWLKRDLAGVDRSRTPWLVAVVHAPWYNSNSAHQREAEPMRRALERVLYDARTDMVFAGHVHAYERSARVFDGQVDPCGPIYITIGDGGNKEGLATEYLSPSPDWSIFREASFGHGELKIFGKQLISVLSQAQAPVGGEEAGGAYGEAEWVWHRNDDDEAMVRDSARVVSLASDKAPAQCRPPTAAAAGAAAAGAGAASS